MIRFIALLGVTCRLSSDHPFLEDGRRFVG